MMSAALKLIVVGLGVTHFSNSAPCVGLFPSYHPRPRPFRHRFSMDYGELIGTFAPESLEVQDNTNYTHTPGIGSHKVHTRVTTWNSARRICEKEGGHLAIINSITELDILRQLFNESGVHEYANDINHVYIGFHELFHDNEWVTIHGEPLANTSFNIWAPGEPNHASVNNEHCGSMCRGGKLNDMGCYKRLGFICEIPDTANAATVGPVLIHQKVQPEARRNDYTYTPNIGAHKVHTQAVDWNSARKICLGEGGHLAIVNSPAESELIVGLVTNSGSHVGSADSDKVHIGFHDLFYEGQFVTVDGESIETVGFNEWASGEPNNGVQNQEDCGSVDRSGKLNDVGCGKALGFVCELPYIPPNPQQPSPQSTTESNHISNSILDI